MGGGEAIQAPGAQTAPEASPDGGYQPVTLTDCVGHQSVFNTPPKRVVAMDQGSLNLLLYLGLGDRVVGWVTYSLAEGVFPTELQDIGPKVPVLAQHPVAREVLLGAGPDLVIASFSSDFDGDQVASQQELADRGINSYRTFSTGCESEASQPVTSLDEVVARNPEVIAIITYDRSDPAEDEERFEEAKRFLLGFPPSAPWRRSAGSGSCT